MANAWHHRSDALSSVVAIVGIVGALLGWRALDPLCGVAVAGLVGWMGAQIVTDALFQLSDTADAQAISEIRAAAEGVDGVLGVGAVRCRWMSSAVLMTDLSVMVGPMTTASAAQKLASHVRAAVMRAKPEAAEVLVRTQTMCPLLSAQTPAPSDVEVEAQVENVLQTLPCVGRVPSVLVRYVHGGELAVDVDVEVARDCEELTVAELKGVAAAARAELLAQVDGLVHVSIASRLTR